MGDMPSQESAPSSTTRSDPGTTRSDTDRSLSAGSEAVRPTIKRRPTVHRRRRGTLDAELKRRCSHRLVDGKRLPVSPRSRANVLAKQSKVTKPCTAQSGKHQTEKSGTLI